MKIANRFRAGRFSRALGALVVGFNFFDPLRLCWRRRAPRPARSPKRPRSIPGSRSIATALSPSSPAKWILARALKPRCRKIVAEELDVPFSHIRMEAGDTTKTVDQGVTAGSRTIERAGPQLRQAAAAARQQLLKLASGSLDVPGRRLVVTDGVVSVAGNCQKDFLWRSGRRQALQCEHRRHRHWLGHESRARCSRAKVPTITRSSAPRCRASICRPKFTGEFTYTQDVRVPGMLHGRVVRPATVHPSPPAWTKIR